jgi:hypothetical protein
MRFKGMLAGESSTNGYANFWEAEMAMNAAIPAANASHKAW